MGEILQNPWYITAALIYDVLLAWVYAPCSAGTLQFCRYVTDFLLVLVAYYALTAFGFGIVKVKKNNDEDEEE